MPDTKGDFLIYGATGYTGELIARRAAGGGMRPVLSGRNAAAIGRLAKELDLPHIAASVDDAASLDRAIDTLRGEHRLVLNCAGPFGRTADQVSDACMRKSVHYLDITGEINVFEMLAKKGARAKHMNVMLLPGVGFDVVPSDCLAAYVAKRVPTATRLVIAIHAGSRISRGTALTAIENVGLGGAIRRDGRIHRIPGAWKDRFVEFDKGPIRVTTMPWGDVATAWYSTGIPNIEVYMAIPAGMRRLLRYGRLAMPLISSKPVKVLLGSRVKSGPPGPSPEQREKGRSRFWAEASEESGNSFAAKLYAPEGYELTVRTAIECVFRTLNGMATPGFQTPSRAFGADLIMAIDGVRREDAQRNRR
jgi:short subunit dehydrogenase-like uncharacterized protein